MLQLAAGGYATERKKSAKQASSPRNIMQYVQIYMCCSWEAKKWTETKFTLLHFSVKTNNFAFLVNISRTTRKASAHHMLGTPDLEWVSVLCE